MLLESAKVVSMYALVFIYKVQCSFEERHVLSRVFGTPPPFRNPFPYFIHDIWTQLTCMHSYMYVVATCVHDQCGTLLLLCLAHIKSVTKIKHLHSRVAGTSTFIRLAQSTLSVCGSSYVHGTRPHQPHNTI